MKLTILATGKAQEYEDGYGARLVEQGKAVPTPQAALPPAGDQEDAPAPTPEKPAAKSVKEKPAKKR